MYKIPGASFCFQIEMVFKFLLIIQQIYCILAVIKTKGVKYMRRTFIEVPLFTKNRGE